jgi:hypothetical protein
VITIQSDARDQIPAHQQAARTSDNKQIYYYTGVGAPPGPYTAAAQDALGR